MKYVEREKIVLKEDKVGHRKLVLPPSPYITYVYFLDTICDLRESFNFRPIYNEMYSHAESYLIRLDEYFNNIKIL